MVIMSVPLVELLCQATMGQIPALEYLLSGVRGPYVHALSCQMVNAISSRDLVDW
jgi:hypothetical protein